MASFSIAHPRTVAHHRCSILGNRSSEMHAVSNKRRRPRMWSGALDSTPAALSVVGSKRPAVSDWDGSDDSDSEDEGILPVALPEPRRGRSKNKRRRRRRHHRRIVSPCPSPSRSPSRPDDDPYDDLPPPPYRRRLVKFSDPLVTETRIRPRTPREDRERLFYAKADERRFRAEVRLEARLRRRSGGGWESDGDEEDGGGGEDGGAPAVTISRGRVEASARTRLIEGPNEVAESSDWSDGEN